MEDGSFPIHSKAVRVRSLLIEAMHAGGIGRGWIKVLLVRLAIWVALAPSLSVNGEMQQYSMGTAADMRDKRPPLGSCARQSRVYCRIRTSRVCCVRKHMDVSGRAARWALVLTGSRNRHGEWERAAVRLADVIERAPSEEPP